jgi:hypothetical protein
VRLPQDRTAHFFVDESGDPVFFDKRGNCIVGQGGCSKILLLGFVVVDDPVSVRLQLDTLRKAIVTDPYFQGIPSLARTARAFHANDDVPEVRERVFKLIAGLDVSAEVVVARKILALFRKRHNSSEAEFYDDIVSKLFQNKLHLSQRNVIYFAKRGSSSRQEPLEKAISRAAAEFEKCWRTRVATETTVYVQGPAEEPCLQVIDYVNWAVYRAFVRREMRFFNVIRDKVRMVWDVYDLDRYPGTFYASRNPFAVAKISPL